MSEDGRYSQGVCGDGAAILYDGVQMTVDEVVASLNSYQRQVRDTKFLVAGMFAGYAARLRRAEPYLRNGTITKYINDMANDLDEESKRLLPPIGEDDGTES
jgi:hypothetical protein